MRHTSLALALLLAAHGASAANERWVTFQGNAHHTGFVDEALQVTGTPHLRWSRQVHEIGINGIAVGDAQIYTTPDTYFSGGGMVAVHEATGLPAWNVDPGSVYSINPVGLDDAGNLFFATGNHTPGTWMHSYTATGEFRWRSALSAQWEGYLAPTFFYGEIAANAGYYGGLYRFQPDGTEIAFTGLPQYDEWTPTPWNDRWVSYTNRIDVINRTSNAIEYTVEIPEYSWTGYAVRVAPVIVGDVAFIINGGRLLGIDLVQKITVVNKSLQAAGQVTTDGQRLYIAAAGMISVRDMQGNLIRNYAIASTSFLAPFIVTQSHAIARTARNTTVIYDLRTHELVTELPIAGEMALADSVLYVGSATGLLEAFELPFVLYQDGFE